MILELRNVDHADVRAPQPPGQLLWKIPDRNALPLDPSLPLHFAKAVENRAQPSYTARGEIEAWESDAQSEGDQAPRCMREPSLCASGSLDALRSRYKRDADGLAARNDRAVKRGRIVTSRSGRR